MYPSSALIPFFWGLSSLLATPLGTLLNPRILGNLGILFAGSVRLGQGGSRFGELRVQVQGSGFRV